MAAAAAAAAAAWRRQRRQRRHRRRRGRRRQLVVAVPGFGGGGGGTNGIAGGGGGGGGYSGGGGGGGGEGSGGGGSFDAGLNQILMAGVRSGDGEVVITFMFAGTPGAANCLGKSVSALASKNGGLSHAAAALEYPSVQALQDAISAYCADVPGPRLSTDPVPTDVRCAALVSLSSGGAE